MKIMFSLLKGGEYLKEWLAEWMRVHEVPKPFPREFSLKRMIVYDDSMVKENGVDEYMSVFSLWQNNMDWYDVVFIDVDGEDAYWKYREITRILLKSYDIEPSAIYFSGRGFHIYLWFDGRVFNDYGESVRKFAKMVGIDEFVDLRVLGDRRRMARIPHTYNSRSGMWVMKINPTWVWAEIKGRSRMHDEWNEKWKKQNEIGEILKEFDENNKVRKSVEWDFEGVEKNLSVVDEYFAKGDRFPPCIEAWKKEMEENGELDHIQRFNLGLFLLHVWGYEKTLNYFREHANDFKERYTSYQLKYMIRRKLKLYRCERLKEMGLCEWEKCPFYPTLNAWVKWR